MANETGTSQTANHDRRPAATLRRSSHNAATLAKKAASAEAAAGPTSSDVNNGCDSARAVHNPSTKAASVVGSETSSDSSKARVRRTPNSSASVSVMAMDESPGKTAKPCAIPKSNAPTTPGCSSRPGLAKREPINTAAVTNKPSPIASGEWLTCCTLRRSKTPSARLGTNASSMTMASRAPAVVAKREGSNKPAKPPLKAALTCGHSMTRVASSVAVRTSKSSASVRGSTSKSSSANATCPARDTGKISVRPWIAPSTVLSQTLAGIFGVFSAWLWATKAPRHAGRLARCALLGLSLLFGCRERLQLPVPENEAGFAGDSSRDSLGGAPANERAVDGGVGAVGEDDAGSGGGDEGGGTSQAVGDPRPPVVTCPGPPPPKACRVSGDSRQGVRLIGTLLEPLATRERGSLDLDADGNIRCAACDCGPAGDALVIDCPELVISPGFINLHDHLSYAGTPPLPHPGELYQHRSDWRLGENGHQALTFAGGASTAEVLAQELRMLMSGTTSIVGAGGRRGWLRNLEVVGQTQGALPGQIVAETFPLDDAAGSVDSATCNFGAKPDTPAIALSAQAYIAHVGEGTNQRASDELRCALGAFNLLGPSSAVVHAMALSRADARELARRGASVVWSPRSNLDLYGSTAPVALLGSLGVHVALGTDWLASGSMNLLRELRCASDYDQAVLGGYFDAFQRWRMVTENPAWALGLAGRLAAIKPGLAGDVAVFTRRAADPYQSVVQAEPADVRLVLRQGTPLYGDAELVSAFRDGEACEAMTVCGAEQRVCALETELSLGAIQQAGVAVYPLFSCEAPPNEPRCESTVSHECPAGEPSCEPPPPLPAWNGGDADGDGVVDVLDSCPRVADADQADADQDGRGDACDDCPLANPGLTPCPVTIAELRTPASRLPLKAAVLLEPSRVTALRTQGTKGFYVEDGNHAPYSGIFVYASAAGVDVGDLVQLRGYFDSFQGTDELVDAEIVARSTPVESFAPLLVTLADAADGSAAAKGLASLFIRVEGASVGSQNPDLPKDYDETGLLGGLRLDDLLWPELDNAFTVGTSFGSIQGIAGFSFGHQKLYPRGPADLLTP